MQISIEPIDPKQFRNVLNVLKTVEPEVTKNLRTELASNLQPYATKIANQMPQIAPLRGMIHTGRTRYEPPKGRVSFTPGGGRSSASRLVAITLKTPGDSGGFYIAELAGTRSKGFTPTGKTMIRALQEKFPLVPKRGGRFAWRAFLSLYPTVADLAVKIINDKLDEIERKL